MAEQNKKSILKTLVITSNNDSQLKVLKCVAEKMGMEAEILSEDEKEDIGLLKAMLEGEKHDYVSEKEVLKALRSK